jgi:hypothetical protein
MGARVVGFQSSVLGFGFLPPVTDNTELETEDACTEELRRVAPCGQRLRGHARAPRISNP